MVLKEWVELYGKPMIVMHYVVVVVMVVEDLHLSNSKIILSSMEKDKQQIPKGYPQEQGKVVEAYNKIIINEFLLQVEELIDIKDGVEEKYHQLFVNSYNYEREHGGIKGMTPRPSQRNL